MVIKELKKEKKKSVTECMDEISPDHILLKSSEPF